MRTLSLWRDTKAKPTKTSYQWMILMDLRKTTTGSEKKARKTKTEQLMQYEAHLSRGMSQRRAANKIGIPRGTLLRWQKRPVNIPLPQTTIAFFEGLDGIAFLERLINAFQFVMNQVGSCGIRLLFQRTVWYTPNLKFQEKLKLIERTKAQTFRSMRRLRALALIHMNVSACVTGF